MISFITVSVKLTEAMPIILQELLKEILLESLTTILLPCTSVQGIYIIAHMFSFDNSTRSHEVLLSKRFTNR